MSSSNSKRLALEASLRIDRICDEFERMCVQNQRPEIATFLERVDSLLKARLFEQLLPLELHHQVERPLLADYVRRFPEFATQIETVFDDMDLLDWTGSAIGPFQISKELASGGMGVVYLAKDFRLDRDVAIKLLTRKKRSDTKWLRRFRREARMASALNHPNILTIYEIGEDQETPYIVTEFVDGLTLREKMAGKHLPIPIVLDYAHQIANGMAAAHHSGIIHRDLKADNVMIRNDGILKILDFGLAQTNQIETTSLTSTGAISGTVHFMSPEQARGEKLTNKTDIFSFGVLLYLMVSGKLPFEARTISEVLATILHSDPAAISKHGISIPNDLNKLVDGCLQKDPARRPTFEQVFETVIRIRKDSGVTSVVQPTSTDTVATMSTGATPTQVFEFDQNDTKTDLNPSEIRYAQSGELSIAWQEIGSGPIDIVFVMGWVSHLDWFWKDPSFSKFLRRLATFARVILFDKRGTGLSDKVPLNELPDLETRMDDVRAVMEAAGSQQAVLCGVSEGGPLCALFAATFPDKTIAIVMIGSYSRRLRAEHYPWGPTAEQREEFLKEIAANWGGPLGLEDRAPSKANDPVFRAWWASYLRMGASPGAAVALTKMNAQIDVQPILPSINVPTLVIHRTGDRCLKVEEGRHLAKKIPGAKFIELPGDDHLPFVGDAQAILNEVELFLTGMTTGHQSDYVLATVLCVELAELEKPTENQFRKMLKHEATLFRGQNFLSDDRSLLMTFDGPVRSVLCAIATCRLAKRMKVEIKCGLDTGTCQIDQSKIEGPAVSGARKVAQLADISSILLTQTLRNLVSSSEISFAPLEMLVESEMAGTALFKVIFDEQ